MFSEGLWCLQILFGAVLWFNIVNSWFQVRFLKYYLSWVYNLWRRVLQISQDLFAARRHRGDGQTAGWTQTSVSKCIFRSSELRHINSALCCLSVHTSYFLWLFVWQRGSELSFTRQLDTVAMAEKAQFQSRSYKGNTKRTKWYVAQQRCYHLSRNSVQRLRRIRSALTLRLYRCVNTSNISNKGR